MSKLLVIPNSYEEMKALAPFLDGFMIGVAGLSVGFFRPFCMDEIKQICNDEVLKKKALFISLNKNMHHSDLELLKETMQQLENLPITAICYYDISLVQMKKESGLQKPLCYAQEHLSTNYDTCNYWYQFGSPYGLLSSEITLSEILEIKHNTSMKLIVPIFGHLPMFVSQRHLISNYTNTFHLEKKGDIFYIEKEGKKYPMIENELGCVVYSSGVLNGISESLLLKEMDYLLLHSIFIKTDVMKEVLMSYQKVTEENKKGLEEKLEQMISNVDKAFLYKETVYRVKKNEK